MSRRYCVANSGGWQGCLTSTLSRSSLATNESGEPMKRYKLIEVSENQLEEVVRQTPEVIEDGLRFLDHQVATDRGPLDVLLVDSGGALVVVELKVVVDDDMLTQGLDYY